MPDEPLSNVYEGKTAPPFDPRSAGPMSWLSTLDPLQSIRIRTAVLFGVMPVLFTFAFAKIVVREMRNQIADQTGPNLAILAGQVSDKLDRAIWERFNEIQVAATLQPMRFGTMDERRRLLSTLATSSPNYVWLAFADAKTGLITSASPGIKEDTEVDERAWFRAGRQAPSASSIHGADGLGEAAPTLDPHYIDISAPVMGPGNAAIGVIAARIDWSVAKEVQTSVIPESTRRARLNVTIYSERKDLLLDSGGSGWDNPIDPPTLPDKEPIRGSFWEETADGSSYLTGYAHTTGYRDFRKLFLLVAVRQQGSELLQPAQDLHDRILAIGFGLAALSAVGGWLIGWRISRRMIAITRASRRIQQGDVLTVIPRFGGHDEISKLSDAVADMANDLRARIPTSETPATFGKGANR